MISLSNVSKEKDIFTILEKNIVEEKNSDSGFFNIFSTISQKKFFNDERVENITSDISDDNIDFGFLASDISSVFNNEITKDMNFSTNFTKVDDGIESLDSILAKINANATKIGQSEADDLVNSITGKLFINSSLNNNIIDNYLGNITDIEQINSFKTDNSNTLISNKIDGSETINDINGSNLKNDEIKNSDNPIAISFPKSDIENIVKTIADDIFAKNDQPFINKNELKDEIKDDINSLINNNDNPELTIDKSGKVIVRASNGKNIDSEDVIKKTINDKIVNGKIDIESNIATNNNQINNVNFDKKEKVSKNNEINTGNIKKTISSSISNFENIISNVADEAVNNTEQYISNKIELKSEIKDIINSLINKIDNPELTIDKSGKVIIRASNGKTIDIKDVIKMIVNDKMVNGKIDIEPIITTNNNNEIDIVNFDKTGKISKNNEINTSDIKKTITLSESNIENIVNTIADDILADDEQVIVNKIGNSEEKNTIENSTKKLDIHLAKNKEVSHKEISNIVENTVSKSNNGQNFTNSKIDNNPITTSINGDIKSNITDSKDLEVFNIDQKEIPLEPSRKFINTISDDTSNQFDEKVERTTDILNVKIDDNQSKETKDLSERIGTNSKSETNGDNNNSQSNNNSQNKQNQPNQPQDNLTNINQFQSTFTKATEPTLSEPNMPRPFAYTSKLGELSSKISTIVSKNTEFGTSTARINLSPKSLGTLVVEITQKKEDLKIVINAESKDIANLIEQNIGGLKEKLISQGINSQNIELNINVQTQTATLMNKGENRDDGKNARQDRKQNRYAKSSDMLSDIEQSTMNYTKYDSGKFIEKYI